MPAEYDTSGTMIHDTVAFKAINYNAVIPFLIGGEQQLDSIQQARDPQNAISIDSLSGKLEWGKNPLLHNTDIHMIDGDHKGYNVYFSGQSRQQTRPGDVGIGYPMDTALVSKLDVWNYTNDDPEDSFFVNRYAGRFLSSGTTSTGSAMDFAGVLGNCTVVDAELKKNINIGGDFHASNGGICNIGVRGVIDGEYKPLPSYGVYGEAMDSLNYWAGMFNGYIGTTAGWYQASDARLKTNVKPVSSADALKILSQLKPSTYTFRRTDFKGVQLPDGSQYGLLAEDVKKVLPGLVRDMSVPARFDAQGHPLSDAQTFEGVNYSALIPLLIASVKQLDSTNQSLQQQLSDLQNCCAMIHTNQGSVNQSTVSLSNQAIILDQNAPNPFADQTTITYSIPSSVQDARILFYDNNGRVIKTVPIADRGQGSLLVYGSDLSSGTYSYTLLADGKVVDTKKMVKQ